MNRNGELPVDHKGFIFTVTKNRNHATILEKHVILQERSRERVIMEKQEKTRYKLAQSVKACMKTTPVDKITVKDIVEGAGVARQTRNLHVSEFHLLRNRTKDAPPLYHRILSHNKDYHKEDQILKPLTHLRC